MKDDPLTKEQSMLVKPSLVFSDPNTPEESWTLTVNLHSTNTTGGVIAPGKNSFSRPAP